MKDNLKRWIEQLSTSGGNSKAQVKGEMEVELAKLNIPIVKKELDYKLLVKAIKFLKDLGYNVDKMELELIIPQYKTLGGK